MAHAKRSALEMDKYNTMFLFPATALSSRIGYLGDFVETMVQSSWTLEKTDSVLLFVLMYQKEKVKRAPKMKL